MLFVCVLFGYSGEHFDFAVRIIFLPRTFAVIRNFLCLNTFHFQVFIMLEGSFFIVSIQSTYKPLNHFDTLFFFDVSPFTLFCQCFAFIFFIVVENDERENTNLFFFYMTTIDIYGYWRYTNEPDDKWKNISSKYTNNRFECVMQTV